MGNFVPHLSHNTEPLRAMLKQDAVFHWDQMANDSFQKIKDLIAKTAAQRLRYCDRPKPVLSTGWCLQRDLALVCYRKANQSPLSVRASQILRPGMQTLKGNSYPLYLLFSSSTPMSWEGHLQWSHKPLEMIHQKSLASAPLRHQWMLLQQQRYNVTIRYRPGKEMMLANALSRCPLWASGEIKLDMRVNYIAFNKTWVAKLKETMKEDPILGTVYQLTQQGWPHQRRHTPWMARTYWDLRDQLSIDETLLLMGPRIFIPSCLQKEYLEKLHQCHLSATKVQQNAWQYLYWPGLDADIIDYTRRCQECIHQSLPPKEPLQALRTHSDRLLLCEWQVVYIGLRLLQ